MDYLLLFCPLYPHIGLELYLSGFTWHMFPFFFGWSGTLSVTFCMSIWSAFCLILLGNNQDHFICILILMRKEAHYRDE